MATYFFDSTALASVQLAAAIHASAAYVGVGLPALTLISADLDLNAAATAEGLNVDDPNMH